MIYINDLPHGLISETKLIADDTSIYSTVLDITRSSNHLNQDLSSMKNWAFQWKMTFNPDLNKQATEVIFLVEGIMLITLFCISTILLLKLLHLKNILGYEKLTFGHHLNEKISKANKSIGLIRRLYSYLPRKSLLVIYKSFIRPLLDYGDIIYDQPHNDTFCRSIESVQYNAALAITGTIKGSSREALPRTRV